MLSRLELQSQLNILIPIRIQTLFIHAICDLDKGSGECEDIATNITEQGKPTKHALQDAKVKITA